jgi:hypothetical protein
MWKNEKSLSSMHQAAITQLINSVGLISIMGTGETHMSPGPLNLLFNFLSFLFRNQAYNSTDIMLFLPRKVSCIKACFYNKKKKQTLIIF